MNYSNGDKIKVGDKIQLWRNCIGRVVCSFDDNSYSDDYIKADWNYLEKGILVKTENAGIIHYEDVEKEFKLISREPGNDKL